MGASSEQQRVIAYKPRFVTSQARPVLFLLGLLWLVLGIVMLVPAAMDYLLGDEDWRGFGTASLLTLLVGAMTVLVNMGGLLALSRRQAFLFTVLSWCGAVVAAAVPFSLSRLNLSFADAIFEAASGLTTTGSTVIADLALASPGVLMWRSALQWVGGIGIVMMAIMIMPYLSSGGLQLLRMESSDTGDKVVARIRRLGAAVMSIYVGLTVACGLAYWLAGMTGFEALNHAFTTVSTGGFSTSNESLGAFDCLPVNWIAVVFMLAGALPFTLYIRALSWRGGVDLLFKDPQARALMLFLIAISGSLTIWGLWSGAIDEDPVRAVTHVALNVTSIVTTTGFGSVDYTQWGPVAIAVFFVLAFMGGCTGSTAGGVKMFRFQIVWRLLRNHLLTLVAPHAVKTLRYDGRTVEASGVNSALLFMLLYVATVLGLSIALTLVGLDWMTAITGAATAVGNVGPGMGELIGPGGDFQSLPDAAKWLLSAGMLLGRLELFPFLVILTRRFWVL